MKTKIAFFMIISGLLSINAIADTSINLCAKLSELRVGEATLKLNGCVSSVNRTESREVIRNDNRRDSRSDSRQEYREDRRNRIDDLERENDDLRYELDRLSRRCDRRAVINPTGKICYVTDPLLGAFNRTSKFDDYIGDLPLGTKLEDLGEKANYPHPVTPIPLRKVRVIELPLEKQGQSGVARVGDIGWAIELSTSCGK